MLLKSKSAVELKVEHQVKYEINERIVVSFDPAIDALLEQLELIVLLLLLLI